MAKSDNKGTKLLIVESPTKAKTIKKILGRSFTVKATVGHIRDLDNKGRGNKGFGIDLEEGYEPRYVIIPGKSKTVADLKEAASKAKEIYLAPDPDREGEAIAWHLKEALELDDKQANRITYRAVTKKAVTEAVANPQPINMNLVGAQKSRRVLDRLVGYSLSPFLWKKIAKNLSAGRVQSVAVRMVVEKERVISAFVPEEFWKISTLLFPEGQKGKTFRADLVKWKDEKFALGGKYSSSEKSARGIETALKAAAYQVANVQSKETSSKPAPPFITSTLQQAASGKLNFGARRTMQVAQKLYEGTELDGGETVGLITYMRTDSPRLDPEAMGEIRDWIQENSAKNLPEKPRYYGGKGKVQDAHEAIRPTSVHRTPALVKPFLKPEQYRLYELIWRRAVASQMKDARYAVTTLQVSADQGLLEAKGRVTLFTGFTVFAAEDKKKKEEFQKLPSLTSGDGLGLEELTCDQNWTKPPPRYNEASLVRQLEKEGIGRPSTYASIVQTIRDRGYVRLEKRTFHATELGMAVNDMLLREFPKIMDLKFTASMESDLDAVERGERDWHHLVDEFWKPFTQRVAEAIEKADPLKGRKWTGKEKCPICGSDLVVRYSKNGAFLGCEKYPECRGLLSLPGEGEEDLPPGDPVHCPECQQLMILKTSRFGRKFYACSKYPECKTTLSVDNEGKPVFLPSIERDCDECGSPMEIKQKKRGPVLVCTNQETCRRELPLDKDGKVIELPKANGVVCEKCGSPMIVRLSRRGPFLACTGFPKCRNAKNLDKDGKISSKESSSR